MARVEPRTFRSDFRRFFVKGLVVLLPTVLTLWILVKAYEFIDGGIAQPINGGIRFVINKATPHVEMLEKTFEPSDAAVERETERRREADRSKTAQNEARSYLRDQRILEWWNERWYMNFIGLFVAILSVYFAGRLLGGLLGRSLYSKIERLLTTIPVVKQVYPYVKQVVDFILSDEKPIKFNRVVLVQYPRKGIWSIGLVTGTPMKSVQNQMDSNAREPGITVFIPSSPTPFTGYTISVTLDEVVEIPISIDEALRFTITGGVLIPDRETIPPSMKSNEDDAPNALPE
ncbi:MAG: hypothetical protein CMJ53_10360 [Planctomycetaceae bacterium]|nr:hypothetical protein [Planctomycetaceae bacterium]